MELLRAKEQFDILVVGAGLAGIRAAVSCSKEGKKVLLLSSAKLCSGSSFYPLMDTLHCLCTAGSKDKPLFYQDIRDCSHNMNDPYMGKYYIDHIADCLNSLFDTGIEVHKLPEKKIACFGHTYRDLYYWKNWDSIREKVYRTIEKNENITLWEHGDLLQILLSENHVSGTLVLHNNKVHYLQAKAVILAGGGMGGLYLHNLNTADVYGSVQAIALKAGAKLINLEFNQFIPGFISPIHKIVFREGSLRYCTGLLDEENKDVLKELLPDSNAYKECLILRETHGPFTFSGNSRYFDIALMQSILRRIKANEGKIDESLGCLIRYSPDILQDERGHVQDYLEWLRKEHHIEIEKSEIRIAPFFHAANGGIEVDHNCATAVAGLFAAGECAGGIHGADRLGGMASGSCLVFGTLAAKTACRYCEEQNFLPLSTEEIETQFHLFHSCCMTHDNKGLLPQDSTLNPQDICQRVKELMWQYGNIIRTEEGLKKALEEINSLSLLLNDKTELKDFQNTIELKAHSRAQQFVDLSRALLLSMLARKESRGAHYREDYPESDKAFSEKRIVLSIQERKYRVSEEAIPKRE